MAAAPPGSERRLLRSWKAIADHLNVDVRTVQRWRARTDIPIAREGSGQRAHPSAYSDDLDRWLDGRRHGDAQAPPSRFRIFTRRTGLILLGLVATAAVATAIAWRTLPGEPVRIATEGDLLRSYDVHGRLCWQRTIPGVGAMRTWTSARQVHDNSLVADVDDDGHVEVLVNVREAPAGDATGRLVCLDHRGGDRWTFAYGRTKTWQGTAYSPKYSGRWILKTPGPGRTYVAAGAVHSTWFPSQVVLLDPRSGVLVEEYWHPGSLLLPVSHDLDGDGIQELLIGGINNPGQGLGHGALVVLNVPFSRMPAAGARSALSAFTGGHEAGYVLFPRPDLCTATGVLPFVSGVEVEGTRILAQVGCGPATAFFYLDRFLRLVDFRLSDGFAAVHDGLFRQNLLNHPFSATEQDCLGHVAPFPGAVDGNGPEASRAWNGCSAF